MGLFCEFELLVPSLSVIVPMVPWHPLVHWDVFLISGFTPIFAIETITVVCQIQDTVSTEPCRCQSFCAESDFTLVRVGLCPSDCFRPATGDVDGKERMDWDCLRGPERETKVKEICHRPKRYSRTWKYGKRNMD